MWGWLIITFSTLAGVTQTYYLPVKTEKQCLKAINDMNRQTKGVVQINGVEHDIYITCKRK